MLPIVFSHANSFPASTYKLLFKSLRARGYAVKAPDKFGHDARYPVTDNWPHLVQQLVDFAEPVVEKAGQPVWLVVVQRSGLASHRGRVRPDHRRLPDGNAQQGVSLWLANSYTSLPL